mmetsp:Transcript_38597/g.122680  ORF Transcript_38597/g.122680 Transcript_38597/m.122680 type:complete len:299 (+) Transcript_38597:304-1200(+)
MVGPLALELGHVAGGRQGHPGAAQLEGEVGQIIDVAAALIQQVHRLCELCRNGTRNTQQRRAAVEEGAAALGAIEPVARLRKVLVQPNVGEVHAPTVVPHDRHAAEKLRLLLGRPVVPYEHAAGAGPGSEAQGEVQAVEALEGGHVLAQLVGHSDPQFGLGGRCVGRLVAGLVVLRDVGDRGIRQVPGVRRGRLGRAEAQQGLEGGVGRGGQLGKLHVPEGLVGSGERPDREVVVGHLRGQAATTIALLCREYAFGEAAAEAGEVARAVLAAAGLAVGAEDHELVRARVGQRLNRLAT